jgi:hypothetical protein
MDGGAESPQETRTRLLLIAAGFPKPQTQIVVLDEFGDFVGRVDMGWEEWPHVFLARVRDAARAAGWPHWDEIRLDAHISWLASY